MNYVLITAARNEENLIPRVLESMGAQTMPPLRWMIMDDGSTDRTAALVEEYAARYPWIELVRLPVRKDRSFAGKARAVNEARERIRGWECEVIGNLDADVSFESGYMQWLMERFREDPELGVAGTPFTEGGGYDSTRDSFEGENFVAGPCQLFRLSCWDDIGGYQPNAAGGVDWIAVMTARMKGWKVRSFPSMRFHHHRPMGTAQKKPLAALFSYGKKDYYLGGSPLWEVFRVAFRMTKRPWIIGGMALLGGYVYGAMCRMERPVSRELMDFHRREQTGKLRAIFRTLARGRKVSGFSLTKEISGAN